MRAGGERQYCHLYRQFDRIVPGGRVPGCQHQRLPRRLPAASGGGGGGGGDAALLPGGRRSLGKRHGRLAKSLVSELAGGNACCRHVRCAGLQHPLTVQLPPASAFLKMGGS